MRVFRAINQGFAAVAAGLLFAIGAMLTFEVVARYFFNAPTIWAEELSRLFLTWAVFLASARLLATGDHIRVTVLVDRAPPAVRRVAEIACFLFVAAIAGVVAFHGLPTVLNSLAVGRTTGSMLDMPSWWSQAAIPLGFVLIAIQGVLGAINVALGLEGDETDEAERLLR